MQQRQSAQSHFCPRGSSMHLSPDALIHHLPIAQDPAMGCPTIIVFYRFWLWSDAEISLVNGAAQTQWVYLYKYFSKKRLWVLWPTFSSWSPPPPTPHPAPWPLLLRCRGLMWTHINACAYPRVWLQLNWREKMHQLSADVLLSFSLNIYHNPGSMRKWRTDRLIPAPSPRS